MGIGGVRIRVALAGRLLRGDKAIDFGVGRWNQLLTGEQVLDELSLMVDAALKFAVLGPQLLGRSADSLDSPAQCRRFGDIETDILTFGFGVRDPCFQPVAATPQAVQAFFFFVHGSEMIDFILERKSVARQEYSRPISE